LKTDIQKLSSDETLGKLVAMNGYRYGWKDTSLRGDERQLGVIAQEVEKVFPEVVSTDQKGVKSVAYSGLVGPIIESVKAVFTHVTTLEDENTTLRRENASIKSYLCKKDPRAPFCP
jgi:hypothetical protein